MMEKEYGNKIINKYLAGDSSLADRHIIEVWYAYRTLYPVHPDEEENYERIKSEIWKTLEKRNQPSTSKIYRIKWRVYAAAVLLVCIMTGIHYYEKHLKTYTTQNYTARTIKPGKPGATLTLADGSTIHLSDAAVGQLATEGKVSIYKSKDGFLVYKKLENLTDNLTSKENIVSTSNGETYPVILPDGSKVWLNSASSLTFASDINNAPNRRVRLTGEGYFEIAKSIKPFVVETGTQKVEVLGTHFNINAYKENAGLIKTTLVEGRVKVISEKKAQIMIPGQQTTNDKGRLSSSEEDIEKILAWKNGFFKFDGSLVNVMESLSRWYDIHVTYDKNTPKELNLWGYVSRSNDLIDVLKQLERTNKVKFEIQGRNIKVLPKKN